MKIASLPDERWAVKAAGWNPELSTKYKTYRAVGRPKKIWEDEINEFLKLEETAMTTWKDMKKNNTWIKEAKTVKDGKQWKLNTQRQQQKDLWTMCYAAKTLRKIQSDQHATYTA